MAGTYRSNYTVGACCVTTCGNFLESSPRVAVATFDLSQPIAIAPGKGIVIGIETRSP